jgi:endogenous inhibitor of DNA gyrase (YacG/DUF329 family)
MSSEIKGSRVIRCPGCGGRSIYATDNPYRPFCSARCKNNDFGAWASEGYAVPADVPDADSPGGPDSEEDVGKNPPH